MARKRPPKRREGKRSAQDHRRQQVIREPPIPETAVSPIESQTAFASERPSSEATVSELGSVDGVTTAKTSVQNSTDEEMMESMNYGSGEEAWDEEDDAEIRSVYISNHLHMGMQDSHTQQCGAESFMGNSDLAASTRSLWARDLDYREIHGRLYCREWSQPIDDMEQMRMSLAHQVFSYILNEQCAIQLQNPKHILDIGTGTGEWAIKMAETYPNCEVVGTDIAAVAETSSVPMNVFFEIEDAEEWDRPSDHYDLIHMRTMEGAFKDWHEVFRNIYKSLKPGGWLEVQDFDSIEDFVSILRVFAPDSPINRLLTDLPIAMEKSGRKLSNLHKSPGMFFGTGLVDVRTTEYQIPLQAAGKVAGRIWLVFCLDALEALCLRPLTEYMGWDPDECRAACEAAGRELIELSKDPEKAARLAIKISVVVGRKPCDGEQSPCDGSTGTVREEGGTVVAESSTTPTNTTTAAVDEGGASHVEPVSS